MSDNSNSVMNWRNRTKEKLVNYKGGKCEKCGYCNLKYLRVFEFHHTGEQEKDFTISGKSWSYERLQAETDKCILVCSNCHKEIHEDLDREVREKRFKTQGRYLSPARRDKFKGYRSRKETRDCLNCGEKTTNVKFCKFSCSAEFQAKSSFIPSKEELLKLKESKNNVEIGKMFGVSETTIRKWLKKLNNIHGGPCGGEQSC